MNISRFCSLFIHSAILISQPTHSVQVNRVHGVDLWEFMGRGERIRGFYYDQPSLILFIVNYTVVSENWNDQ